MNRDQKPSVHLSDRFCHCMLVEEVVCQFESWDFHHCVFQEEKLKENHAWFLDTFKLFKGPNQNSRDALDAKQVKIGSHQLTIQPHLKDAALKFSSLMGLDEVQSYILVDRSVQQNTFDRVLNDLVMIQFYTDRQCILKCTRQILSHAYCKVKGGEFKTRGSAQLDAQGKFKASISKDVLKNGKLNEECYAHLHSASATPCPAHQDLEESYNIIVTGVGSDRKQTFSPAKNICAILSQFTEDQMNRYGSFWRSAFQKANMNKADIDIQVASGSPLPATAIR